jgi:hypothetical protein
MYVEESVVDIVREMEALKLKAVNGKLMISSLQFFFGKLCQLFLNYWEKFYHFSFDSS